MAMPAAFDDLSVLVVDDDEIMRMVICRMLRRLRVGGVAEADGAEEALDQIAQTPDAFDLVICDWNMPGMTGMDLFTRVQAIAPGLPFLMVTGRADTDSMDAAKAAGVPGYIVKPTSTQELKAKITSLVA
jgi:two-component system, chemotaxis family, chemotaxis protein CheY